jgi:hypothetical protein
MITFDTNWYDIGKEAVPKMPELTQFERAQESARQRAFQRENRNYQQQQDDKMWIRKMMEIDPIAALSAKSATEQQNMLNAYNQKWASRYTERKGELTEPDKLELIKDRVALQAGQKKILSDNERYLNYQHILDNDTNGHYQKEEGKAKLANWLDNGGDLPTDVLKVRPQNMVAYLRGIKKDVASSTQRDVRTDEKGNTYYVDTPIVSKEAAQRAIASSMDHEGRMMGVIQDFDTWANKPENYKAVNDLLMDYDRDKNGTVDPAERQYAYEHMNPKDNPVIHWALNNPDYLNELMEVKESATKNPATTGKGVSFNWNMGVDFGNNRNMQFQKKQDIPIQKLPLYKNFYDLQLASVPTVMQKVLTYKNANTGETKTLNKAINVKVVGYSPDNDKLLLNVEEDNYPIKGEGKDSYLPKDTKIEVDAAQYDDLLKSKPYGFSREKAMKQIGNENKPTIVPPKSGVTWK